MILWLAIGPARAACPVPPPPQIVVTTAQAPVIFDTTRSDAALTAMMQAHGDAGWVQSARPDIKGMLQDRFVLGHVLRFDTRRDPQTGSACLAIGQIAVTLKLQAKIYVATGYDRDPGYFQRIFIHEDDRLTADRALLEAYGPRLRQGLQFAYSRPADYTLPPLAPGSLANGRAMLETSVADSLTVLFRQVIDARSTEQRQIDVGR